VTVAAHLRIGTLEITALLAVVAIVGALPRRGAAEEIGPLSPVKAVLRIVEVGRERLFESLVPLTIGRDSACEVVVSDPEVSRRHARLEADRGVVFVRDLESRNGTFLNGKLLRGVIETRVGDEIDVGATRVIVEDLQPWT
jgi:pSer/pThr/pTyr-binding forkhead associated (FHA) protein